MYHKKVGSSAEATSVSVYYSFIYFPKNLDLGVYSDSSYKKINGQGCKCNMTSKNHKHDLTRAELSWDTSPSSAFDCCFPLACGIA